MTTQEFKAMGESASKEVEGGMAYIEKASEIFVKEFGFTYTVETVEVRADGQFGEMVGYHDVESALEAYNNIK